MYTSLSSVVCYLLNLQWVYNGADIKTEKLGKINKWSQSWFHSTSLFWSDVTSLVLNLLRDEITRYWGNEVSVLVSLILMLLQSLTNATVLHWQHVDATLLFQVNHCIYIKARSFACLPHCMITTSGNSRSRANLTAVVAEDLWFTKR